jgi:hypothetical protein
MGRMNRLVSKWAALVMTTAAALSLGCSHELPPAMAPTAATSQTVPDHEATIVMVRPESRCDTADYSIVVDDRGQFIGNLGPGTQLTVAMSPGTHVFYAWSNRDLRFEAHPEFNPVAAIRVNVAPLQTYHVALIVHESTATSRGCNRYAFVDMVPVRANGPYCEDLQGWLKSTKPLAADGQAGQAMLAANSAMTQSYLDLGRAKLQQLDERRARREVESAR